MARITAAFASSHSVMLTCELEDWLTRFVAADQRIAHFDYEGNPCTYAELERRAPKTAGALITPEAITRRFEETAAAMERMKAEVLAAKLDALIIVGDDQRELFPERVQPALGIYYGETIRNAARRTDIPADDWYRRAQERRREPGAPVDYPCHAPLALHLILGLTERGFDVTALKSLAPDQAEGHAFSFIHYRYTRESGLPIVPVMLNTYYAPNQPTPVRARALGAAITALVQGFPEDIKVGILASGGLSHFIVDEALDHQVIEAIRRRDLDTLAALPVRKLKAGSSEIRNWIVAAAAAAAADLEVAWVDYVPSYRTPALTGTGLGFLSWRPGGAAG